MKPKKCRLVIEFDDVEKLKMFMAEVSCYGIFHGDINVREMDQLDFKRHKSNYNYYIVRRHSCVPEMLRLFKHPLGDI